MNHRTTILKSLRIALAATALVAASGAVHAQAFGLASPYLGGSVGETDGYGTGLRLFGGASFNKTFGWEAALTSFGSDTYARSPVTNAPFERSAWAVGGMGTARFPLTGSLSAFGKLGVHYVNYSATGPGLDTEDSKFRAGIGAGLLWQFSSSAALRLEAENIGGSSGDLLMAGVQFGF